MIKSYLRIYAFNDKEKEILSKNKNILNETIKLKGKDIYVYFDLKECSEGIGVTDLVKKRLVEEGYDVNDQKMYKPRKIPGTDKFYATGSFWGCAEYRVDTFSRSLNKLIKAGLVDKTVYNTCNIFQTVVK